MYCRGSPRRQGSGLNIGKESLRSCMTLIRRSFFHFSVGTLRYSLNLLCFGGYKHQHQLPIETLTSMLRLGRKYLFDGICDEAFKRIREVLPSRTREWTGFPNEFCLGNSSRVFMLVKILLEIGNQTLLPSLFYRCAYFLGPVHLSLVLLLLWFTLKICLRSACNI